MRPLVKPALRRQWLDAETLQLGTDPAVAVVLTGLSHGTRAVLDLLDGERTEVEVRHAAADAGVMDHHVDRLLDTLLRAGALEDADAADPLADLPFLQRARLREELAELSLRTSRPGAAAEALGRRQQARVSVRGAGRVGAPLVALLAAAGTGAVAVVDPAPTRPQDVMPAGLREHDIGCPRDEAAVRGVSGATRRRRADGAEEDDLVVLAQSAMADLSLPEQLRRNGVPHLVVTALDGAGVIGPLVRPGVSACVRCLHLHRHDRSRYQSSAGSPAGSPTGTPAGTPAGMDGADGVGCALVMATAALAAIQILAFLDAQPAPVRLATVDGTVELRPPDWRLRRRTWPPHPDCGCID